jgi:hypothetical protein
MQLPATSVFGRGDDGKMPMQAYARFLNEHDTPPIAVVTEMYFDDDSDVPKLFFKPVRPLEEAELQQVASLLEHPDTKRAITFSVAKPKEGGDVSAALTKPKKAKKAKVEVDEGDEPEEPKKVAKKSDDASDGEDPELDAIVDAWDD